MAEYKQYITQVQENGNVMISEDVIATIVENTLTEVDGVVKGGGDVVGKKSWGKGIRIAIAEDNSLTIGCNIIVGYGESVINVAKAVQEAITMAVESVTGVAVTDVPDAMEAVGYVFEKLVLYAQSLGLGTCWLGGTFNRSEFAKAMELSGDEFFPIASPIGYPAPKNHTVDKIMRKAIKADTRKSFDELFFEGSFDSPLVKEAAGEYLYPLEMTRLAPSAKNAQPWRILHDASDFHFYEKKTIPSSNHDIQRLDIGIAVCHFELAAKEKGLSVKITEQAAPHIDAKGLIYVMSCITE